MRLAIGIGTAFGLLVVITVTVFHATAKQAQACSPAPPPPMIHVLEGADLAFVGEVISIDRQSIKGDDYPTFEDIIEFRTSVVWKGEPYETMFVGTTWFLPPTPISNCPADPIFFKGIRYIVFVWEGRTHLSANTPTQRFDYAPKDQIATLGSGKTPIPGSVSPIPERKGQPVVYERSGSGCSLTPGYALGSINLSVFGLAGMLAWFWIRQRFRR